MEYAFTNHQRPTIEHIHLLKSLGITSFDPWASNISLICDVLQLPEAEVDERAREFTKDGRGGSISEALCEFLYEEFLDAQEAADALDVSLADFEALVEGGHVVATGGSVLESYVRDKQSERRVRLSASCSIRLLSLPMLASCSLMLRRLLMCFVVVVWMRRMFLRGCLMHVKSLVCLLTLTC